MVGFVRDAVRGALIWVALAGPAWAGTVTLRTDDGVSLHAVEYGTGSKAVVLVHGDGRSVEDWSYLGGRLASNGFHVLAIDLRGHGASGGTKPPVEEDYPAMAADVKAGVAWFRKKGIQAVTLVGAELGANLSLNVAVEDPNIPSVVLLSPGLNYHGVKVGDAMVAYGTRPALVVTGSEDEYGARSARFLEAKAGTGTKVEYVPGDASGARLLNRSPDVEGSVVAWLNGTHHLTGDQNSSRSLETGTQTQLDTQGVKFGGE